MKVSFTDASLFTDTTTYLWDFGDGTFSHNVNPSHIFYEDGEKEVKLFANGLDNTQLEKDTLITVYEMPSASFTILPE